MRKRVWKRPAASLAALSFALAWVLGCGGVMPPATPDEVLEERPAERVAKRADSLVYPPLPEFEVPEPTRVELANGMVLILVEDHELPLIDAFVRIRTGARLEAAEKVGVAGLVGAVLRTGGTMSMTGPEIDRLLENRAASIETGIGVDSGSAAASSLVEDFPEVLELLVDILRNPLFDEEEIAVAKNRLNDAIARQNDNADAILRREFVEVVLGADSPYARQETFTGVAALTRADLIAFHRRYFHPANMILGIVGDFETDSMVELVRDSFGEWQGETPTEPFEGGYDTEPKPGVFYVEKNDVTQSSILIGHLGVRKDNPDFYAIEVFNEVLSGGFTSRLLSRVRSEQGLAYAVRGSLGSRWDRDGLFQLYTSTKTETTGAAIESLLTEARKIVSEEPPTEEEVERAKRNILSSFVFASDSAAEILGQQLTYEYHGYPLDRLSHYVPGIESVTTEQVAQIGSKYIDPGAFTIFVVGPDEGRDRSLAEFGELTEVDATIPPLDEEAVEAAIATRTRGAELMAAAVAAHGGETVFARFDNIRQHASARASTPQGDLEAEIDQWVLYPDRMRQVVILPFGAMTTVFSPEVAFVETPQGRRPLEGAQRRNVAAGLPRTLPVLLRSFVEGRVDAVAAGSGKSRGAEVDYVEIDVAGERFQVALDSETSRVVELAFRGSDFTGSPGEVLQVYSDFRDSDGMILPFRIDATFDGEPYLESTVSKATLNSEVAPALFEAGEE